AAERPADREAVGGVVVVHVPRDLPHDVLGERARVGHGVVLSCRCGLEGRSLVDLEGVARGTRGSAAAGRRCRTRRAPGAAPVSAQPPASPPARLPARHRPCGGAYPTADPATLSESCSPSQATMPSTASRQPPQPVPARVARATFPALRAPASQLARMSRLATLLHWQT